MSNYLREVLGAEKTFLNPNQPQGLVADIGPDIPGGEGANEGFWREQIRDRIGRFAKMFGNVLFDIEIEGLGRITGHGEIVEMVRPQVALVRVKNHKVLPDGDYEIPGEDLEGIDGLIKDADYERITGNDVTPNTEPAPELKDEITGDEALKTIRSYVTSSLKEEGRFPVIRSDKDIEKVVSEQYKGFFDQIKQEDPELLKVFGKEIPNADLFWDYIKANYATDLMTRYLAPEDLPPLMRRVNQLYAEKFLGLKKDGLLSFYRNNIRGKDTEADAAAGYASLDKYMAFDYNVARGLEDGGPNTGRYEVKAKPDEVNGLIGFSRIGDEIGVVLSPEVTAIPGRTTRVGDLEIPNPDNAPWLDLKNVTDFNRDTGGSPFRQHRALGQFDYYGLDKDPFGGGQDWASFYEAHGLEKGAIPQKYDELHGEGAWARDWEDFKPRASYFKAFFTEYKDEDGVTKWGIRGDALWSIGMGETDLYDPKANDGFEKNIKILSTMQELMGKPFFVSRGHSKNDPRLDEVKDEEPPVEKSPEPIEAPTPDEAKPVEQEERKTATPESDSIDALGTAKTVDSLPASKIYGEHRYRPASEIKLDIKSEDGELSSEELQAIDEYMSADYREINAATRMYPDLSGQQMLDSVDPATIKVAGQWTGEEYELDTTRPFETIQLLDSAFSNSALQEDEIVYRGVHMSPEELQALLNLEVGSTIIDTGYLSTTTNLTLAQEYAERINGTGGNIGPKEGNKAVIYRIKALKGTPATQNQDLERGEDELILARNLNLKVTGISKTSKGVVVLDVETQPAKFEIEQSGVEVPGGDVEFFDDSEKPIDFSSFEKVSDRLGSNPGGIYKDPKTSKQYYVKIQDKDRGNNERLASAIYKEAGLGSLEVKDGILDGNPVTYTEWKEDLIPLFGTQSDKLNFTERQKALDTARDGYLIDAWIANWDIVGEGNDNISTDKDGNPVRLDAGGALLYRARGSKKGDSFGNEVIELDTFRDPSNTAELMYGNMYLFPRAERESYEKLKAIIPERIDQLVDQYISNSNDSKELKEKLKARRQFILDKYEGSNLLTGSESRLYGSKTTQNISKEDEKEVTSYTNAGYRFINRHLREPENPDYQRYKDQADKLNDIISANTLTEDTTLTRVTKNFDEDFQAGDIIEDAAIQSTTKAGRSAIHSTVMDKLYSGDPLGSDAVEFLGYTTYTIKAPAGTPALDVTEMSQFRTEGEVLLPAGTKFKVVSYERKPMKEPYLGSFRNIEVEVVTDQEIENSNPLTGLETSTDKKEPIEPDFKNSDEGVEAPKGREVSSREMQREFSTAGDPSELKDRVTQKLLERILAKGITKGELMDMIDSLRLAKSNLLAGVDKISPTTLDSNTGIVKWEGSKKVTEVSVWAIQTVKSGTEGIKSAKSGNLDVALRNAIRIYKINKKQDGIEDFNEYMTYDETVEFIRKINKIIDDRYTNDSSYQIKSEIVFEDNIEEAKDLMSYSAVSNMVKEWAGSSNDDSVFSLALQDTVAKLFNLENYLPWTTGKDTSENKDVLLKLHGKVINAYAESQYEITQEELKAKQITSVELHRGMNAPDLRATLDEYGYLDNNLVILRPLSSFSYDIRTAQGFAGDDQGAIAVTYEQLEEDPGIIDTVFGWALDQFFDTPPVLKPNEYLDIYGKVKTLGGVVLNTTVDADKIFSMPFSGVGCLNEAEVVVLGPNLRAEVITPLDAEELANQYDLQEEEESEEN